MESDTDKINRLTQELAERDKVHELTRNRNAELLLDLDKANERIAMMENQRKFDNDMLKGKDERIAELDSIIDTHILLHDDALKVIAERDKLCKDMGDSLFRLAVEKSTVNEQLQKANERVAGINIKLERQKRRADAWQSQIEDRDMTISALESAKASAVSVPVDVYGWLKELAMTTDRVQSDFVYNWFKSRGEHHV
jgi:chromosome segregation ATPase